MRSSIVFFIALATFMVSFVHAYGTENKRSIVGVSGDQNFGKVKRQVGPSGRRGGQGGPAAGRGGPGRGGSAGRGTASPAGKSSGKGGLGGLTNGLPLNVLGGIL